MGRAVKLSVLSCVLIGLMGSAVHATPIVAGQTVVLVAPEPDPTGGVDVAPILTLPFVAGTFSGTLTSRVLAGDPSNGLGGLTFTYLLHNNDVSPDAIHRITVNGFDGFLTDGSYQGGPGQVPTTVDRSTNGDVVGFGFIGAPLGFGALMPNATSALLVVQTNAPAWQQTFASVIDGTVTTVGTYSPVVPEPVTMGLMALGMGFVLIRRR